MSQHPSARNVYPYNRGVIGVVNGFKAGDAFEPLAVPEGKDKLQVNVAAGSYQVLGRVGEAIPLEHERSALRRDSCGRRLHPGCLQPS